MATVIDFEPAPVPTLRFGSLADSRLWLWARIHRISLIIGIPILMIGGGVRFWNIAGSPGMTNDDEGTYVSQAWAILHNTPWQWLNDLQMAHYTYWYDHPPFGWMQIAGWAWLTDGFGRHDVAVMVGRELVVVYAIVAAGLMYLLCRSLHMARWTSALAMVLMLINPLGMTAGRMVYLDGLSVPWVIGALLAARMVREIRFVFLSAILLAGAIMTKETTAIFIPVVVAMIVAYSPRRFRIRNTVLWTFITFILGGGLYLWYAINRGELTKGSGHVSIQEAVGWQLLSRGGSGSIFDPTSLAHETFARWARDDWYLLAAGLVLLPLVLFSKRLWPIGLAAVVNGVLLLRTGYLPTPFVVILVPLAALVVAAGFDRLWHGARHFKWTGTAIRVMTVAVLASAVCYIAPTWHGKFATDLTVNNVSPEQRAVAWMRENVPTSGNARIVTDDYAWPDLVMSGYHRSDVDWFYKLDVDPAVTKRYVLTKGVTQSWQLVDYVILPDIGQGIIDSRPTLSGALKHATRVATFKGQTSGSYSVYKVNH